MLWPIEKVETELGVRGDWDTEDDLDLELSESVSSYTLRMIIGAGRFLRLLQKLAPRLDIGLALTVVVL